MRDLLRRLYSGDNDVDFMGGRRRVGVATLVILAVCGVSLITRGLDLGIEFEGGIVWEVPRGEGVETDDVTAAIEGAGMGDGRIQFASSASGDIVRVRGGVDDIELQTQVTDALADLNQVDRTEVSRSEVGPSWGEEITRSARNALIWFFALIALYIAVRFEWRMAIAALAAVAHDIVLTVGIYSLFGFDVTPATVIAFLTILGYSLYDTIVVFDKVRDNEVLVSVRGEVAYDELLNRSLNQVVMRSINTSVTSVVPVLSMLVVGAVLLGATALQEFALALLIGLLTGAYSSFFVASPVLLVLHRLAPRTPDNEGERRRSSSEAPADAATRFGSAPRPRKRSR